MIRDVHLHGRLGTKFGRVHALDVDSPQEAFRALASQLPGFRDYVSKRKYAVSTGSGVVLDQEQLPMRLGSGRDIHVTPAGLVTGIETILLVGTLLFTAVAAIGVLSMPKVPTAGSREEATKTSSFIFDGATNSTEQGHPLALIYGRFRVGSVVGSAGITTSDVNEASVSADPTNPGGGAYSGYVGSTPGIKGSIYGDEWVNLQKGGKGGSGTARSAQEDPNSLQSQATAKILDLIGEGEIVGLVDGLKSVYFDQTPLQNDDDSFNFAGVAVEQRVGLPDQDFVPGFSQTENTTAIDTKVSVLLGAVTRTINDPDVTVARVTIRLPQLYKQDTTNGDLKATSVAVKISVQADGGGFTDVTTMTFNGKTNSGYQRSTDVRLPNGVERQIRVTRVTPDADVASLSNETRWDLLTEVVEAKLSYPDTALVGLTVDARQFGSNIPARSYDVKGLIIEVPSNYDPETRAYAGVWDGTFKRAWTDNPAWVFRDIIVNRRYGLGSRIGSTVPDKWALYAIAQYNDQLVPDGFGGMQPRYTINCCINNPAAAYDVIASIASNFRGWAYWGSGSIVAVQDSPEDPSVLVTPANVVDGKISYGRVTPLEKRRSVAVVYWNDPEDGFKLTPEVYEVPDLVRRFGRRTGDEVTAFGVTNQGQAHRMCRWIMEDEAQGSNSTALYNVGDDHGFVEPGRIASVADPMFTASRRGGRVKGGTNLLIQLDAPVNIAAGQVYTLRLTLPNGTTEKRTVTSPLGFVTQLQVVAPFSLAPNPGSVWTLETDTVANRQFRVRSIATDEPPYEVHAVLHDPTKYERVELDRDISSPSFLDLPTGPLEEPTGLDIVEFLLQKGNAVVPAVQFSWNSPRDPRLTFYQSQFRRPDGSNWEPLADSIDISRVVEGSEPGGWSFRVRGLDSLGNKTAWVQYDEVLDGQVDALPNVSQLAVATSDDALQTSLIWIMPDDTRPLRAEVLFSLGTNLAAAESLGVMDGQEYPVAQPGNYWVRTRFMNVASANPPMVEIGADELPKPAWETISDRPENLNDLDPDAQQQINDLVVVYGDTESAAASAAAALAAKTASEAARNAAQAAQDVASSAQALAEQARTDAQGAFSAADAARAAALGYRNDALGAQTAAETANSAAAAAKSAAETARNQAQTYAGNADGSAQAAAGSASSAASSQTAAGNSATAASASNVSVQITARDQHPTTFTQDGMYFAGDGLAAGAGPPLRVEYVTTTEGERVAQNTLLDNYGVVSWASARPHVPGNVYLMRVRARRLAGDGNMLLRLGGYGNQTNGTRTSVYEHMEYVGVAWAWYEWKAQPPFTEPWVQPQLYPNINSSGTRIQIAALELNDVTSQDLAAGSAAAASTSASAAGVSATEAGTQAAASSAAKVAAETARGQAQAAQTAAAASETNAAGSASSASSSSTLAATAKGQAETAAGLAAGSASAAAGSASAASASESAAGQSATSASGSATTASTKAGEASTSATQASQSKTDAAGSASSAASAASVSATARDAAQAAADRLLPSTPDIPLRNFKLSGETNGTLTAFNDGGTANKLRINVGSMAYVIVIPAGTLPAVAGRHLRCRIEVYLESDLAQAPVVNWRMYYNDVGGRHIIYSVGGTVVALNTPVVLDATVTVPVDGEYSVELLVGGDADGSTSWVMKSFLLRDVTETDLAAGSASAAAASASAASASQVGAAQQASAAQTSATNAATSESNASTSASQASQSKTDAAGSASSAAIAAGAAAGSATAAGTSAGAASGSAGTASTQAGLASASAASAQASEVSATATAARMLPPTFADDDKYWLFPEGAANGHSYFGPTSNRYLTLTVAANSYQILQPKGRLAVGPGRRVRVKLGGDMQQQAAAPNSVCYARLCDLGGAGGIRRILLSGTPVYWPNQYESKSPIWDFTVPVGALQEVYFEVVFEAPGAAGSWVMDRASFSDITESYTAGISASAASTSASAASASESAAGQSASAASGSKTSAETAASNASASAGQAATSASNAAGSASAAASSQSLAAGSASTAGNSAGAAATSAGAALTSEQNASTSATNAGNAAAAAASSAVLSARVSTQSLLRNPRFAEWSGGSGTLPAGWVNYGGTAASIIKGAGLDGKGNTLAYNAAPGQYLLILATAANNEGMATVRPGYYIIEIDVMLRAGNLQQQRFYFQGIDAGGNEVQALTGFFNVMPDASGVAQGDGVAGKTYSFRAIVQLTNANIVGANLFVGSFGEDTNQGKHPTYNYVSVRPAAKFEIDTGLITGIAANVTTLQSATAALDGRTQAYWAVSANAGGTSASIEARATTNPDGSTSSKVGIVAEEFSITNTAGGIRKRALRIVGADAYFDGSVSSGTGVYLGSGTRWSYQLKPKDFAVADGTVVTFGVTFDTVPTVDFSTIGLPPLAAGETYQLYAEGLTGSGFTARLKISTPGATSSVSLTADTVPGSGPTRQIARGANGESSNGGYTFSVQGTYSGYAYFESDPGGGPLQ